MRIGWNGEVVDASEAVISVYDHGFLYGMGLFETFRTYGGEPYLLDRHLNRLSEGCEQLGIPFGMEPQTIQNWVQRLLAANGLKDGYVRLTVSAGAAELGLPLDDYEHSNSLLLVKSLPVVNDATHMLGRKLQLLRTRRNTPEGAVRFKSLHYMNNIIAKREMLAMTKTAATHGIGMGANGTESDAQGQSADREEGVATGSPASAVREAGAAIRLPASAAAEGLMLSEEGWLAEGIVSNLFFVRGDVICTPSIATGILPGITRGRVLELAQIAGYAVEEGLYHWYDLLAAEEIWMTNSIQELVPITVLTDLEGVNAVISGGEAGPITRQLLSSYRQDTIG